MTTISEKQVDLIQGETEQGQEFGYVSGDDGGFFFTWHGTLEETLDSIEEDEVSGDGGLGAEEVREYLESYLPTTRKGRDTWGSDE